MPDLFTKSDAVFSHCQRYRYSLSRTWDTSLPVCCWIMLNPSTASADQDDPTITRVIRFSQDWGFGGLRVVNLFAWRATDPDELKKVPDPVGNGNDTWISFAAGYCGGEMVAAWGVEGKLHGRDKQVLGILRNLKVSVHHLGLTKDGYPRHPLYLSGSTKLVTFGEADLA